MERLNPDAGLKVGNTNMKINLAQVNNQARQLREQADALRGAQSSMLSYQHNLNNHWKGVEMTPANRNMDEQRNRFAAIAADLESISNDIIREAEAIRREEEMAEARAAAANN